MANVVFDRFPGGRRKALTMSYDDGVVEDRPLVALFNKAGLRGTFHLNSGWLSTDGHVAAGEVAGLYAGHEVSVHGVKHECLPHLSRESIVAEILEDRRALERLVGYPVRGMSFAGGGFDSRVLAQLPSLGIEYARVVSTRAGFALPDDFLRWEASCHHGACLARGQEFLQVPPAWGLQLLYVWGHSYEFARAGNWQIMEQFCEQMGGHEEIWYATNIEIVDYMNAVRAVRCGVDEALLHNLSGLEVWFTDRTGPNPRARSVGPGQLLRL